MHPHSGGVEV